MTSRHRERVDRTFDQGYRWTRTYPGPVEVVYEDVSNICGVRKTKTIDDTLTPNYTAVLKCGDVLPLNPVYIETVTETRIPATISNVERPGDSTIAGTWYRDRGMMPIPDPSPSLQAAAVLAAVAKASSSIHDTLTFFATLSQSVGTLQSVYTSFFAHATKVATKATKFKDRYAAFQQLWLETRYGLRPMCYDVRDIVEAMTKALDKLLIVGTGSEGNEHNSEEDSDWYPIDGYTENRIRRSISVVRTYRGWAAYQFSSDLQARFGTNPLLTAWEVIPYSFIVDWFIDIGSWVSTLPGQLSGGLIGPQASLKSIITQRNSLEGRGNGVYEFGSWGECQTFRVTERYERGPTSVPLPPLNPRVTLPKLVDLVFLCVSRNSRILQLLAPTRRGGAKGR